MTFSESVRTCLREKYATFSGRASRSEFWWFFLAFFLLLLVLVLVAGAGFAATLSASGGDIGAGFVVYGIVFGIIYLALIIPLLAVTVRRYHDRNISGWWYGGIFAIGLLPNIFPELVALSVISLILGLASLVICILKGTAGPNKFGPDPLGGGAEEIFS